MTWGFPSIRILLPLASHVNGKLFVSFLVNPVTLKGWPLTANCSLKPTEASFWIQLLGRLYWSENPISLKPVIIATLMRFSPHAYSPVLRALHSTGLPSLHWTKAGVRTRLCRGFPASNEGAGPQIQVCLIGSSYTLFCLISTQSKSRLIRRPTSAAAWVFQDVGEIGEVIHLRAQEAQKMSEHPQAMAELGSGARVTCRVAGDGLWPGAMTSSQSSTAWSWAVLPPSQVSRNPVILP